MDVIGVSRSPGDWLVGDVAELEFVENVIREHRPDIIFHLAAHSTTRHEALFEHHRTIGQGTLNILESVRRWAPECRVFITGSGLQFINVSAPISETDPFDHSSSYVIARNYSVQAARYFRNRGIKTYVGYLFHHESPFRNPNHVSQKIAQAALRIAAGSRESIQLGDISTSKEWTFAGDVVEAIMTLVNQDDVHEATIGSGEAHTIEEWLDVCFGLIHADWREHVGTIEGFTAEYPLLLSAPKTINSLGWRPRVSFHNLAEMMMRIK
jgi:GDPmannose 4,6-dehydratase